MWSRKSPWLLFSFQGFMLLMSHFERPPNSPGQGSSTHFLAMIWIDFSDVNDDSIPFVWIGHGNCKVNGDVAFPGRPTRRFRSNWCVEYAPFVEIRKSKKIKSNKFKHFAKYFSSNKNHLGNFSFEFGERRRSICVRLPILGNGRRLKNSADWKDERNGVDLDWWRLVVASTGPSNWPNTTVSSFARWWRRV